MNEQKLSLRLEKVASYVPQAAVVADIGSDHAYLPAWLILNGVVKQAVAGEVVKGPFESANQLVQQLGLESQITVRLANGLEAIEPTDHVSAITIAGMGGSLISEILDRGFEKGILTGKERLILQPNIGERKLRLWLQAHQYQLVAEELIEEDGKRYEILVAEKATETTNYSPQELLFGPFLLKEKSQLLKDKWAQELVQKELILSRLSEDNPNHQDKINELKESISWIKELIQ
ncbi:tRNA (adenine-N(1))-methyltransferase [Vagococcus coleopterorum]|uniref:tRNA (Adenine-N(1))-methyltransferase n=1 Tax=Vagococcus coleopterorum TaxID=2714946 RepID=A0A6G8AP77_9ENTE|nr:tRNA (adenine(22)-N(1))-methyltransferase TrmK [Vagococcus coleopterorum]QIL46884.1 tRNA (adenine-N(1))-methyltransferase [Vagococcus coleopterorum]